MINEKRIRIFTPYIKLDSFLKLAGACSTGGEAKQRIKSEEVKINDEVCVQRGKKLFGGEKIILLESNVSYIVEK